MDPGLTGPSSPAPKKPSPADSLFPEPNHNRNSSCSSSTTSDSSDGDDYFQLDALGFGHPPEPLHPPQIPDDDGEISLSGKYTSKSHIDDHTQIQTQNHPGEFKPPVHPMVVRNDVPDPNRIPSSVFTRTKSTSPMEWSVASNESLFSIHMGNSSFSRDHVFLMGRSDEQTTFSGMGSSPVQDSYPTTPNAQISSTLPPLPPVAPVASIPMSMPLPLSVSSEMKIKQLEQPGEAEATNAEAMKDVLRAATEEHESHRGKSGLDGINYTASVSRKSNSSCASFQSFAFPILTGDGRNDSVKVEPAHQQMQPKLTEQQPPKMVEAPKMTPHVDPTPTAAPSGEGWLSCFSCCFGR